MKHIETSRTESPNAILVEDLRTKRAPAQYLREDVFVSVSINSKEDYLEFLAEWKAELASSVSRKVGLRDARNAGKGPGTVNSWYGSACQQEKARARLLHQIREAVRISRAAAVLPV